MRRFAVERKTRLRSSAGWVTASLLILLGALVVLWGTEYKLSLYKAESTMQTPAKLCTRSSEAAKTQVHLAIRPAEADAPLLDTVAIGPGVDHSDAEAGRPDTPPDVSLPSSPQEQPQIAFRPPPALTRVAA